MYQLHIHARLSCLYVFFLTLVRTMGVHVWVSGGKWIRRNRCATFNSDGDKERVPLVPKMVGSLPVIKSLVFFFLCALMCHITWGFVIHCMCFTGSARRKLTCTICNRKCSSSLNLQEHRKVRSYDICCTAQFIPTRYFALDLRGFTQLT